MSPDRKICRARSLWLLLACLWAAVVDAGIEAPAPPPSATAKPTPAVAEPPAVQRVRPAPPPRATGRILRCWQYGRLIFEEPVARLPPNLAGQGYRFGIPNGKGVIQLLDIHTATCTVR